MHNNLLIMRGAILSLFLILSACGGSIETRLLNAGALPNDDVSFVLPEKATANSPEYKQAEALLISGLAQKGLRKVYKNADAILNLTLSQRPANLSLSKGEGDVIAHAKEKKPFQSCSDQEFRIAFNITRISDGAKLYSGAASEYHCKATFSQSIPAMMQALLSDLDSEAGERSTNRSGVD